MMEYSGSEAFLAFEETFPGEANFDVETGTIWIPLDRAKEMIEAGLEPQRSAARP